MRIRIKPYASASKSVKLLTKDLQEDGIDIKKIRNVNSTYRAREGDIIFNWGSPRYISTNGATLLNKPEAVDKAANKVSTFEVLKDAGVPTVKWTLSQEKASQWPAVFCRHKLRGHSGSGIAYCSQERPQHLGNFEWLTELPPAPLYTKAVEGEYSEYRLHVFAGEIIYSQQKKRRNGWQDNPNYSKVVRNFHTGWVYAHESMEPYSEDVAKVAIDAVKALGLDFGAVDLIVQADKAIVLEVNTAPGLSGVSSRLAYKNAFKKVIENANV